MLTKQERTEIVTKFGGSEKNTGKTEVQVALLTARVNSLSDHFKTHKLDYHSNRGLLKMIGQRRSLLKYLSSIDPSRYQALIKELGLRK